MRWLRLGLAAAGLALLVTGGWLLVYETREDTLGQLVWWLAGAVVLHDGLLAPLVLLAGWALAQPPVRGVLRGAFVVAGSLTLVALPVLLRPGPPANPTVLPLDYPRNWALSLALVALVGAVLLVVGRWRARRPRSAAPPSPVPVPAPSSGPGGKPVTGPDEE